MRAPHAERTLLRSWLQHADPAVPCRLIQQGCIRPSGASVSATGGTQRLVVPPTSKGCRRPQCGFSLERVPTHQEPGSGRVSGYKVKNLHR